VYAIVITVRSITTTQPQGMAV